MHFIHIVSLFAAAMTASVLCAPTATTLPVVAYLPIVKEGNLTTVHNAPNGAYTSFNETHLAYHGVLGGALPSARGLSEPSLVERQSTCDVSCHGSFSSASDIQTAQDGLRQLFSSNPVFFGSISYVFASVWAFGCDYGNGQSQSTSQWQQDIDCTNAQCGSSQAGWNSHHSWKSAYGRLFGGFVCNDLEA